MRNDANDELDNLPSLTPERREDFAAPREEPAARSSRTATKVPVARGASTGPLWALVGALSFALAGLGFARIGLRANRRHSA